LRDEKARKTTASEREKVQPTARRVSHRRPHSKEVFGLASIDARDHSSFDEYEGARECCIPEKLASPIHFRKQACERFLARHALRPLEGDP
jgi:hypothetical protein